MHVVLTGATGFLGVPLCAALAEHGHTVTAIVRDLAQGAALLPGSRCVPMGELAAAVAQADAIVNLAGAPIAGRRWSEAYKQELHASRIETTRAIVRALQRPGVILVSASAVGYYGDAGERIVAEDAPPGSDFLARLCVDWEAEARAAATKQARVVLLRTGVVLGAGGGALAKMVTPFRWFVGGPVGNGRQWVPWIHLADEIGLIRFALESPAAHGPMNATAPEPVTMRELARELGRALHRPALLPVPAFALRLLAGEVAYVLVTGQRALPTAAERWGYKFRYPSLAPALAQALGR
jgi:uncharacterized protein (TIGR01777 family)